MSLEVNIPDVLAEVTAAFFRYEDALVNNKDGFTSMLAVVEPNLLTKPSTVMFNKVTLKGAKQAVQMFGPAQRGIAMAVADSVEDGTIPMAEADNLFICVSVFIHWLAEDDKKILNYNYLATKEAIQRAVTGWPKAAEVVARKGSTPNPSVGH
jgi:5,6,7,8-tetrahydromethanopterin hydro-lyase